MRGGQRQAISLVERLSGAILFARPGAPLLREASERQLDVHPLSFRALAKAARQVDLVHAHDARAHTLAAIAGGAPLVVSRRVAFPLQRGVLSSWQYGHAALSLRVSHLVAGEFPESGSPRPQICVLAQ